MTENYIICDLDGCLIDTAWIWRVVDDLKITNPECYDVFNRLACADYNKIDNSLLNYLNLKLSAGFKILFLTARSEKIKDETIRFIRERTGLVPLRHFIINFRPQGDHYTSVISKHRRLEAILKCGKQIEFAIDDEPAICEMYEAKGIHAVRWQIGMLPIEIIKQYGLNLQYLIGTEEPCLN